MLSFVSLEIPVFSLNQKLPMHLPSFMRCFTSQFCLSSLVLIHNDPFLHMHRTHPEDLLCFSGISLCNFYCNSFQCFFPELDLNSADHNTLKSYRAVVSQHNMHFPATQSNPRQQFEVSCMDQCVYRSGTSDWMSINVSDVKLLRNLKTRTLPGALKL